MAMLDMKTSVNQSITNKQNQVEERISRTEYKVEKIYSDSK
jgi:hypothetical protein